MTDIQLRQKLKELKISQADIGRILGVTGRAVNLWVTSQRKVPGYVDAYFELFCRLPRSEQLLIIDKLS